jgi:hypothetical protein
MHKPTLVALSWCFVIAAATVLILEVHRSHTGVTPPTVMAAQMPSRGMPLLARPETATVSSPAAEQATPAAANYVGNTNTHKFHRMTCRYASCKNCTVHFATRDEALAAGFRPGGCCDP